MEKKTRKWAGQLRELERDQLVTRTQYPEMPPRVEYSPSKLGETMRPTRGRTEGGSRLVFQQSPSLSASTDKREG